MSFVIEGEAWSRIAQVEKQSRARSLQRVRTQRRKRLRRRERTAAR